MEKFKTGFLKVIKSIADIGSIAALILTVLAGVLAIFYNEISDLFTALNWSQDQLAWMTLSLGGLGTAGVITTRVSRGLKAAIVVSKTEQERIQAGYEKELNARVKGIEQAAMATIASVEQRTAVEIANLQKDNQVLVDRVTQYEDLLEKQQLFDRAQAQKYIDAPDSLVSPQAKIAYQEYLDATETAEV